jgi:hypothetical protein
LFKKERHERRVATVINNSIAFGVGVAAAVPTAGTPHATHAAAQVAAVKHRVAAATEASVNRGNT